MSCFIKKLVSGQDLHKPLLDKIKLQHASAAPLSPAPPSLSPHSPGLASPGPSSPGSPSLGLASHCLPSPGPPSPAPSFADVIKELQVKNEVLKNELENLKTSVISRK